MKKLFALLKRTGWLSIFLVVLCASIAFFVLYAFMGDPGNFTLGVWNLTNAAFIVFLAKQSDLINILHEENKDLNDLLCIAEHKVVNLATELESLKSAQEKAEPEVEEAGPQAAGTSGAKPHNKRPAFKRRLKTEKRKED